MDDPDPADRTGAARRPRRTDERHAVGGRPNCHLCGKPQNRWYGDLRFTGVGKLAVCIPCANSRRLEGEWENPDAPGQRATNVQVAPGVRFVPSLDAPLVNPISPS